MLQNIRHILFDLGGVLLNIDFQKTVEAFKLSGCYQFDKFTDAENLPEFFYLFETGAINQKNFFKEINHLSERPINDLEIIDNWNAMLLEFPLRRLQILQQLQIHFDLMLVSNTNEIHEACFNQKLKTQTGFPSLNTFFDKVYYSHKTGLRKPDPALFKKILEENSLNPEKTLLIDDSKVNTDTASQLGIQTIWLQEGMTIEDDVFREKR